MLEASVLMSLLRSSSDASSPSSMISCSEGRYARAIAIVDLPALGDGDPEAGAEREAEVVGGREIRRVGDGEEGRAVVEDAQGQRLVPARQLLRQQGDCLLVELGDVEVDELELVLLGQRARDRPLGREAEGDRDLAEAPARRGLLLEHAPELFLGEDAAVDQQLAERNPSEPGFGGAHALVIGRSTPLLNRSSSSVPRTCRARRRSQPRRGRTGSRRRRSTPAK